MIEWQDEAIVIAVRPFQESKTLVQLFTENHGMCGGLMHGVKKHAAMLQQGNQVKCTWKARSDDQLGTFQCELHKSIMPVVMQNPMALHAISALSVLLAKTLPERDPHIQLYDYIVHVFYHSMQGGDLVDMLQSYVSFELLLLQELGYGLDLESCAATGQADDLYYVSPKTGRAVSKEAGAPYHDKLLRFPAWLQQGQIHHTTQEKTAASGEIIDALTLTGYFLERYLANEYQRDLPESRGQLVRKAKGMLC